MLAPYEFAWAERIDLTQKYVHRILSEKYTNRPLGIPGNDDYGTMSSWAFYGYLGIYPRAGDGLHILNSPIFSNVTLHREGGDIHIIAYNTSKENIYVSEVKVNGNKMDEPFMMVSQVLEGGIIEFTMTDVPSV